MTKAIFEGTESVITDAESYVYEDATVDEPNAAIFIKIASLEILKAQMKTMKTAYNEIAENREIFIKNLKRDGFVQINQEEEPDLWYKPNMPELDLWISKEETGKNVSLITRKSYGSGSGVHGTRSSASNSISRRNFLGLRSA